MYELLNNKIREEESEGKTIDSLLCIAITKFFKALLECNITGFAILLLKKDYLDPFVKVYDNLTNKKGLVGSVLLSLFKAIERKGVHYENLAKHLAEKHPSLKLILKRFIETGQPKEKETPELKPRTDCFDILS